MIDLTWENIELFCEDITNVIVEDKKIIVEDLSERRFILSTIMAKRQFLNHLGLGYRATINDDNKLKIINEAIRKRAEKERLERLYPLVFRKISIEGDNINVGSVVTAEYTEIPIEEVREKFEEMLNGCNINFQVMAYGEDSKTKYFTYRLNIQKTVSEEQIQYGLILSVGHSGDRSIGVYQGYTVLKCNNNLIGRGSLNIIHKTYPKEELLNALPYIVNYALKNIGNITEIVERNTRDVSIEELNETFIGVIKKYPKHIQEKLITLYSTKYNELKGYWRISQCLSDVGSNSEGITPRYRQVLQRHAYNVLQEAVQR